MCQPDQADCLIICESHRNRWRAPSHLNLTIFLIFWRDFNMKSFRNIRLIIVNSGEVRDKISNPKKTEYDSEPDIIKWGFIDTVSLRTAPDSWNSYYCFHFTGEKTKILRRQVIYWPSHSNEHEMPRCLTINLGSAFSSVNTFTGVGGGACSLSHSVCPPLAAFLGLQKASQWEENKKSWKTQESTSYDLPSYVLSCFSQRTLLK